MHPISSNSGFDGLTDPISAEALKELPRFSSLVAQQEEENCPICLDSLSGRLTQNFHETHPEHPMHMGCFSDFIRANTALGRPIPCPSCRAPYSFPPTEPPEEPRPRLRLFSSHPSFPSVSEETREDMNEFISLLKRLIEEEDFDSFSNEIRQIQIESVPIVLLEPFFFCCLRCCIEKNRPRFLSKLVRLFNRLDYVPFAAEEVHLVGSNFDTPILSIAAKSGDVALFRRLIPGLSLSRLPFSHLQICIETAIAYNKLEMVNYLTSSRRALSEVFGRYRFSKERLFLYYERINRIDLIYRFFPALELSTSTAIILLTHATRFNSSELLTKIFIDSYFNPKRIEKDPILFEVFQAASHLNNPPVFSVLLEKTNLKYENTKLFPVIAELIQSNRFDLLKIASKHVFLSEDQLNALKEYALVAPGRAYLIDPLNEFPHLSLFKTIKLKLGLI